MTYFRLLSILLCSSIVFFKLLYILEIQISLKCVLLECTQQYSYCTRRSLVLCSYNRIGEVMVSVFASGLVDRRFEPRSGQTKDYEIDMCCFSAKHAALNRQSKDWLALNQDNASEWRDMSSRVLLFHRVLVQYNADLIISLKIDLFSP